jgi:hypothetical protein
MNKSTMITIIIAVVVGAVAFYGGMQFQASKTRSTGALGQFQGQGNGQGFYRNGGQGRTTNRNGMRPVAGEILNSDANSVTVKMQDGSTKIVLLSSTTSIIKADKATKDDLKTGTQVAVFGTSNSDGSVTAQSIQLNPQFNMMRNGQTPSGTPSPTPKK